jgi:membrane-associated phospholipid phosphatase
LVIAVVVAAIGILLCYLLMIHTAAGQHFDNAAYLGSQESAPRYRHGVSHLLDLINASTFALALVALVVIGWARRRFVLGVSVAIASGVAVEAADAIRNHLHRPWLSASDAFVPANTFPSGHTTAAVACALALTAVCAPRWRGVVAVATGAYASATAAQVQTALWHRPSDAFGGALLAFTLMCAALGVVTLCRDAVLVRSISHRGAFVVLGGTAGVAAALLAWSLSRVWAWTVQPGRDSGTSHFVRHDAYLAGLSATVLLVVILVTTFLAVVGSVDIGGRPPRYDRSP